MDFETDSVITDLSVLDTPMPYKRLPDDKPASTTDLTYSSSDGKLPTQRAGLVQYDRTK